MFKKIRPILALMALPLSNAQGGTIFFEIEGQEVKQFEAVGVTYAEIYKVVAAFAGVKDELAASPSELMQISFKDKSWGEIMLSLYNPKVFLVERRDGNKLIVTRLSRKRD